jgi:hypothetical protein
MKCRHLLLLLLLVPLLARPADAGIIFGRKPKKPATQPSTQPSTERPPEKQAAPTDRVSELLTTIKTDGDENRRADAAAELRQYDPAAYPAILPTLIDVLRSDPKPGVRAEAAQTLGKVRPISQQAGQALEQAQNNDSSMRVRLQARTALLGYHWSGYHGATPRKEEPLLQGGQTREPPLADPVPTAGNSPVGATAPTVNTVGPVPARLAPQAAPSPPGYRPQAAPQPFPAGPTRPVTPDGGPELTPP